MTPRAAHPGRPSRDPTCAGCPQLGTLRALRRAGLESRGGLWCEPPDAHRGSGGPFAALAGAERALEAAPAWCGGEEGGARLLVVADRPGPDASAVAAALEAGGVPTFRLDPARLHEAEALVARLTAGDRVAAVLAIAPCARSRPAVAPLAISAARCNRCGACLGLGCPAISDTGGEAMAVDPRICTGCGLCAPLCRSRAIA